MDETLTVQSIRILGSLFTQTDELPTVYHPRTVLFFVIPGSIGYPVVMDMCSWVETWKKEKKKNGRPVSTPRMDGRRASRWCL